VAEGLGIFPMGWRQRASPPKEVVASPVPFHGGVIHEEFVMSKRRVLAVFVLAILSPSGAFSRGGSFFDGASVFAVNSGTDPSQRSPAIGFRCAR